MSRLQIPIELRSELRVLLDQFWDRRERRREKGHGPLIEAFFIEQLQELTPQARAQLARLLVDTLGVGEAVPVVAGAHLAAEHDRAVRTLYQTGLGDGNAS